MKWNVGLRKKSVWQFTHFMTPLVLDLGRSKRRQAAHYVAGLLIPGQRKSMEPMAARLGVDPQRLDHPCLATPQDRPRLRAPAVEVGHIEGAGELASSRVTRVRHEVHFGKAGSPRIPADDLQGDLMLQ
jgi:hypothetical protein